MKSSEDNNKNDDENNHENNSEKVRWENNETIESVLICLPRGHKLRASEASC